MSTSLIRLEELMKAVIHSHKRKTKSGKVVQVREHTDSRGKKEKPLYYMSMDEWATKEAHAYIQKIKDENPRKRPKFESYYEHFKNMPEYAWGIRDLLEKKKFDNLKDLLNDFAKYYYDPKTHGDAKAYLRIGLNYSVEKIKGANPEDVSLIRNNVTNFYDKVEAKFFPKKNIKKSRSLHGRMEFQGLQISIENRRGSLRQWYDPHNKENGTTRMKYPYGYIRMTEGTDGDHVDCYVGPHKDAKTAYVVHQMKAPDFKTYDEDKVMLGFSSMEEARSAYLAHYNDKRFLGSIITMPMEKFKAKVLATRDRPGKIRKSLPGVYLIKSRVKEHLRHNKSGKVSTVKEHDDKRNKNEKKLESKIERKIKGTRTFFYPTVNGVRLNSTNYARKYDAVSVLKNFLKRYSEEKILEMIQDHKNKKS